MQHEFLLAGFGGQGVMFAGQLLAYAGMDAGMEVTWIPSYGPEMRGGTAHCTIVLSDKPIGSPIVAYPRVVVALNNPSFDKYHPLVKPGGVFVYNQSLVDRKPERSDIRSLGIPASALAEQAGSLKMMNVVMLGAVLTAYPIISISDLKQALDAHIPAHRRDMLAMNYDAVDAGVRHAALQGEAFPLV